MYADLYVFRPEIITCLSASHLFQANPCSVHAHWSLAPANYHLSSTSPQTVMKGKYN